MLLSIVYEKLYVYGQYMGENPLKTGISDWILMVFVHVSKQEVGQWCESMMIVPAAAAFHCLLTHTSAAFI